MKFSDYTIGESKEYWDKATDHIFIKEMVDGVLDKELFAKYLVQDYAFVNSFLNLVSYTIAYSKTIEQKNKLSGFLNMITSSEDDYFIRSFNALGIKEEDYNPKKVVFSDSINAFDKAIERAIETKDYNACIVVLFCAESIYCTWGCKYAHKKPDQFYFNEWLLLHNNEYFKGFVSWLKSEVDNISNSTKDEENTLLETFKNICKLELRFFDESYGNDK